MNQRTHPKADITWYDAWAVAAPGLEVLLAAELKSLGFVDAARSTGGVAFRCDAYGLAKAQLWSRLASRVVVRLASFRATAFHELERAARKVEWARFIAPGRAVTLRVTCRKSKLYHSDAVAERVAEAIPRTVAGVTFAVGGEDDAAADDEPAPVQQAALLTAQRGAQLILVRLDHDQCTISADASGELLHRRGYRLAVARAPLRETLAAAMLSGAKWDASTPLVDPMCGSGTIAIEAAMLARCIAPGLARSFAAEQWPELDLSAFTDARVAVRARALPAAPAPILASDRDAGAIEAARANAVRAGVEGDIEFSQRALSAIEPPAGTGLLVMNPPYGVRVGEKDGLRDLFARLGQVARERFGGWQLAMLSAEKELEQQVGLRFEERWRTSNGGIPVRLITALVR